MVGHVSNLSTPTTRTHTIEQEVRRDYFLPVIILLIVLAWIVLWVWEQSPYGRYLNHAIWTQNSFAVSICRAIPGGNTIVPAILYVAGWVLMTIAMMLPTTLPLLEIFRRLTVRRADQHILLLLLVLGYLLAWSIFGVIAHAASWGILEAAQSNEWIMSNPWVPGAAVLFLAGGFQFGSLKYRCLEKCRSPFSFITQHWRGRDVRKQSFLLGTHHAIYCIGCCWALMMLMFAVGTGSVGWMLVIGAVMAVEKNVSWGRKISLPVGVVLLVLSEMIVGQNYLSHS